MLRLDGKGTLRFPITHYYQEGEKAISVTSESQCPVKKVIQNEVFCNMFFIHHLNNFLSIY